MQIEHDHVSMESELESHWTEIMSDKTINAITKSLIEDDGKIEISKLAPYITRKAI